MTLNTDNLAISRSEGSMTSASNRVGTPAALHSNITDRWYTPRNIIDSVNSVLGEVDLDPASDHIGNSVINANRYITEHTDGLTYDWATVHNHPMTCFLNPPSGKRGKHSLPKLFWEKLVQNVDAGVISHAIFLAYSVEQLQTTQSSPVPILARNHLVCMPSKRVRFVDKHDNPGPSPSHSSAIVYIPGIIDNGDQFRRIFSQYGKIISVV